MDIYDKSDNMNASKNTQSEVVPLDPSLWQFDDDTTKGAQASAIHYSLIETAKANGLEPYSYLTQVLKALPYADTVEKLEALLPWNIKNTDSSG